MTYSHFFALLDHGTKLLWPTNKSQACLFDLPERKQWTEEDRRHAIGTCASWWEEQGILLTENPCVPVLHWSEIRTLGIFKSKPDSSNNSIAKDFSRDGVAKDVQFAADLFCIVPKTLANSLSSGLSSRSWHHRWLLCLGRILQGYEYSPGYCFHLRSFGALNEALSQAYTHMKAEQLDAADATLLLSVLSQWQHRRPTEQVRANRGKTNSRRKTPKSAVGLSGSLLSAGTGPFSNLFKLAVDNDSATLIKILLEAAQTEAHFAPHSPRITRSTKPPSTPSMWLNDMASRLSCPKLTELLEQEREIYRYRLDIMQAYLIKQPFPTPPESIASHPYIQTTRILNQIYHKQANPAALAPFFTDDDWDSKAMQWSRIQERMRTECTDTSNNLQTE